YVSTVSMVATVAISALAGYGLGRIRFAGRGLVYGIVLIGLTIPLQIALIPLFMNLRTLGLLNTPFALIGPYTGFGLAFGTFIMKGFFEGLPRELEEAARLDGAGEFGIFARVMLPLTRPALATVAIFLFLQNWNEFLFALTFITEARMLTLPTGIYALLSSEFYGNYPILAASLVLFSAPVLVLYFLFQQQFVEGLTARALKHRPFPGVRGRLASARIRHDRSRSSRSDPVVFLQLDLDEGELEGVGVADVVLDAGRPEVRLAGDQVVQRVAGRPAGRQ